MLMAAWGFMVLLPNAGAHEVGAARQQWEFSGDRQPSFELLVDQREGFFALQCQEQLNILYENYAKLYPDYRPLMGKAALRKNWRQSLVHDGIDNRLDSFNFCVYSMLSNSIQKSPLRNEKTRNIFCGRFGNYLRETELQIAESLQELTGYALYGSASANYHLLNVTDTYAAITMNDDVRYYFQELLKQQTASKPKIRKALESVFLPETSIKPSPKRRKFVEDALARGDYQTVLATSDPC